MSLHHLISPGIAAAGNSGDAWVCVGGWSRMVAVTPPPPLSAGFLETSSSYKSYRQSRSGQRLPDCDVLVSGSEHGAKLL